jgi:imidazolonepropionase-like amidohydrolase
MVPPHRPLSRPPSWGALALALFVAAASPIQGLAQERLALHCGRILDVEAERHREDGVIVVVDGRIAEIGGTEALRDATRVLDLRHATCLPGLIDLHVHLLRDGLESSSSRRTLDGLRAAQTMLRTGFTTIRTPGDGGEFFENVELRNAFERGEFLGPRMRVAPHYLSATGGHADMNQLAPDLLSRPSPGGRIVPAGADSMREAVRNEIKYGADWIKVYATGGVMSAGDDPSTTAFTGEELRAAVEEAHRYGKRITVHAIGGEGVIQSVLAGVDAVEHAILIDEEGIALMLERGTWLIPTLFVLNYVVEEGPRLGYRQDSIEKARTLMLERDDRLRRAFAAGVRVAYGSDTIFPHEWAPREFAQLVRLGLPNIEAIRAATISAATVLGLEQEIGSLQIGKAADIVAVEGNPLADIQVLEDVGFVLKGGVVARDDLSPEGTAPSH